MSEEKECILEPITVISKLITLSFHPIGTKIAFRDHKVILCDSNKSSYLNNTFGQGFDRFLNGDSRNDIYMLNNVLHNFIDWYVMVYKENDNKIYNRLLKMILYLIIGLKRLQKTYKKGNIVYVLQYYINVLQSIFDDKYDDKMLFRPFDEEEYDETKYSTIFDTNKLRNFWSSKDIISISNQLNKCFSFDDEKNECYPINENNSIIKGTLVGIDAIMENMDDKFKKIIYKSVKGS